MNFFQFYQDTLDTSAEDEKAEKMDDENLDFSEPDQNADDGGDDQKCEFG